MSDARADFEALTAIEVARVELRCPLCGRQDPSGGWFLSHGLACGYCSGAYDELEEEDYDGTATLFGWILGDVLP